MKLLYRLSNLFFPPKCVICGKLLETRETDLCHSCRCDTHEVGKYSFRFPHLAGWTALWYYEGSVRDSILRFKFGGRRSYAATYGRMLAMKLVREQVNFDILTWVPISRLRKWRRGYDQVELLAQAIAQELNCQSLCTLQKIRNNRPQSSLSDAAQRRANVLGIYRVRQSQELLGKRVLLLDDIITTGATASECARVLRTAGVKEVFCAALAVASHQTKNSR